MACRPHRVTSGQSNSGHKQIHISKLFSHIYISTLCRVGLQNQSLHKHKTCVNQNKTTNSLAILIRMSKGRVSNRRNVATDQQSNPWSNQTLTTNIAQDFFLFFIKDQLTDSLLLLLFDCQLVVKVFERSQHDQSCTRAFGVGLKILCLIC